MLCRYHPECLSNGAVPECDRASLLDSWLCPDCAVNASDDTLTEPGSKTQEQDTGIDGSQQQQQQKAQHDAHAMCTVHINVAKQALAPKRQLFDGQAPQQQKHGVGLSADTQQQQDSQQRYIEQLSQAVSTHLE